MSAETKISVLMSVYNPHNNRYFFDSVMSIVNQSFQDWEMILYDDGSDEAYIPAIREMAELDDRIRYVRCDRNRGLGQSLNACIDLARGDYLARMDADDVSGPERLEKMYEFLLEHKEYDWVGCNVELINDNSVWGERVFPRVPGKMDFLRCSPYAHPAILFRKEVFSGQCRYECLHRGEDYALFMRLHAEKHQGYNLQTCYFQYREDEESYRRRKYRYQIEEVGIRFRGFRQLEILRMRTLPYVIKPLIIGLFPPGFLMKMKILMRKELHVERIRESQT